MAKGSVYIIRHGSTDLNKESGNSPDRIRGWVDVPLNDKGREDAEKAAKKLKGQLPSKIYSSDLIRAEETADIINKHFHAPIITSMTLRPWNLGVFQGKETSKVIDELNDHVKNENEPVKDGESFKEFRLRYLGELKKIIDEAKTERKTIFVVSHFRNLKTAMAWCKAGCPDDLHIDLDGFFEDSFKPGNVFEIPLNAKKGDKLEKE